MAPGDFTAQRINNTNLLFKKLKMVKYDKTCITSPCSRKIQTKDFAYVRYSVIRWDLADVSSEASITKNERANTLKKTRYKNESSDPLHVIWNDRQEHDLRSPRAQ